MIDDFVVRWARLVGLVSTDANLSHGLTAIPRDGFLGSLRAWLSLTPDGPRDGDVGLGKPRVMDSFCQACTNDYSFISGTCGVNDG